MPTKGSNKHLLQVSPTLLPLPGSTAITQKEAKKKKPGLVYQPGFTKDSGFQSLKAKITVICNPYASETGKPMQYVTSLRPELNTGLQAEIRPTSIPAFWLALLAHSAGPTGLPGLIDKEMLIQMLSLQTSPPPIRLTSFVKNPTTTTTRVYLLPYAGQGRASGWNSPTRCHTRT
jgi:hypothetical protein